MAYSLEKEIGIYIQMQCLIIHKGIEMINRNPGVQKYNNRNEEFRAEQQISTGKRKNQGLENRK